MRDSAFWMKQLDERILEFIKQEGWATPRMLANGHHFDASRGHIHERCRMLHDVQFVAPIYGDAYELTTDDKMFLAGQIDASYRP